MALRYPKNMGTEWMNLKQDVKNAFTSANSRIPYTRIGAGIVQIFTSLQIQAGAFLRFTFANNQLGMFLGRHVTGGDQADGLFIRRNDGTLAFWTFTKVDDGFGYTAIYDRQGNILFSDDANKQMGIARPWLAWTWTHWSELTNPPAARLTANTTDTDIIIAHTNAQHARVRAVGYASAPTSTVEIKFWSYPDDTLLYSRTASDGWQTAMDFDLASFDFGTNYYIKVSIRRASGTGNVGFSLLSLMGAQSPAA